jgi:tetratricopeptide (TPR) repeat protein
MQGTGDAGAQMAHDTTSRRALAWAGLAGICLLALALRLAFLWETSRGPFGEPGYLPIDARLYHAWAIDWLAGSWPTPRAYYRPPLYTWFVGLVYAVAGPDPAAVKIVQSGLGAATAALVWAIGRELFAGAGRPLLGAAIWAICGISIFFDAQLLPGSLDAFLQTALVWTLLVAGRTRRLAVWSAAGLLVALCALHRGGALLLLPLLLIWILLLPGWSASADTRAGAAPARAGWRRFAPPALALLLPGAIAIAPVAWHNAAYDRMAEGKASLPETVRRLATGRFISIAESSAVNLRLGNAPVLRELNHITHPDHFAVWERLWSEPYLSGIASSEEANRFIVRETVREVAEQPVAWLGIMLEKSRELVSGAEIPRNTSIYPDRKYSRVLSLLLWKHGLAFPSGLIIPLGLAGIWLVRRSWRAHFAPLACLAVQAIFVVSFFVTARYRLPSLPLLSLYAAHAGLTLATLIRERRRPQAARLAGGIGLLLLLSNHAVGAMPASHWPVEHADLARTLKERNKMREAEVQLRAALAQDPDFPAANEQLCALLLYADRAPEALPSCTRAVASQPESAALHHKLGVALEAAGRRPAAIAEYRTALRLEPGNALTAEALARALEKRARRQAEREELE